MGPGIICWIPPGTLSASLRQTAEAATHKEIFMKGWSQEATCSHDRLKPALQTEFRESEPSQLHCRPLERSLIFRAGAILLICLFAVGGLLAKPPKNGPEPTI